MGVAPSGKSIAYDEIFIFRFTDGRVVETEVTGCRTAVSLVELGVRGFWRGVV
jgi:predicted ester cyclase